MMRQKQTKTPGGGGLKSKFSILENFGANFEDPGHF